MAQTTVELRNLLKTNFELFDFEYEFDDQAYAKKIEQAIIAHYYFSEIGQETPDRFKHVFRTRFLKIISYYNKLHNTTLLEYNPLINMKMTEALERLSNSEGSHLTDTESTTASTQTGNNSQTTNTMDSDSTIGSGNRTDNTSTSGTSTDTTSGSTDTTGTSTSNQTGLDYPQNTISGDYRSDEQEGLTETEQNTITSGTSEGSTSGESETSSVTSDESTRTGESESTTNGTTSQQTDGEGTQKVIGSQQGKDTETYEKAIEGLTGRTYQELIQLERNNLLRITSMIIQELKPCFMLTY